MDSEPTRAIIIENPVRDLYRWGCVIGAASIAVFSRKAKTSGVSTKCIFAFDSPPEIFILTAKRRHFAGETEKITELLRTNRASNNKGHRKGSLP